MEEKSSRLGVAVVVLEKRGYISVRSSSNLSLSRHSVGSLTVTWMWDKQWEEVIIIQQG